MTYTADDRSFSVTLPAKPQIGPKTQPAAGIVATMVTAQSGDVGAAVTHLVIDPGVAFDGPRGMRGSVDQVAKGSGEPSTSTVRSPSGDAAADAAGLHGQGTDYHRL